MEGAFLSESRLEEGAFLSESCLEEAFLIRGIEGLL